MSTALSSKVIFLHKSSSLSSKTTSPFSRHRSRSSFHVNKLFKAIDWLVQKQKSTVFIKLKSLQKKVFQSHNKRNINQLIQCLQKRIFPKKLWVFYKLKSHKDSYSAFSTLFSHISSPRIRLISYDQEFKYFRAPDLRVKSLSRVFFILGKVIQTNVLKSFWEIYSVSRTKQVRPVRLIKRKLDLKGFTKISVLFTKRKHIAFDLMKKLKTKYSGFFSYLVSRDSIRGMRILNRIFDRNKEFCTITSFRTIKGLKRRILPKASFMKLIGVLIGLKKRRSFGFIKGFAKEKKNLQKFMLLCYYLKKVVVKFKGDAWYKIRRFVKVKSAAVSRGVMLIHKVSLKKIAASFVNIRRFSKELVTFKRRNASVNRTSNKIFMLPTIFLEGDPSYHNYEDFTFSATNKRRTLFKF